MKEMKKVDRERVLELYRQGKNMSEIGRILGHHHGCISYHIHRSGYAIRLRKNTRNPHIITSELIELYKSGFSLPMIAKKYGLTNQSIYDRFARAGFKIRPIGEAIRLGHKLGFIKVRKGKENHNWKGGRFYNPQGYVVLSTAEGRKFEHQVVWEKANGVKIPEDWVIHHINGIKDDNRIENLLACPRKQHSPRKVVEPYINRIRELEKALDKVNNGGK